MSMDQGIRTEALAVLLATLGSYVEEDAVAVLAIVPPNEAGARAETETVTVLPAAMSPRLHETSWLETLHGAPLLLVAPRGVPSTPTYSLSAAPRAVFGPAFLTSIV
jgi:hypothetical protein